MASSAAVLAQVSGVRSWFALLVMIAPASIVGCNQASSNGCAFPIHLRIGHGDTRTVATCAGVVLSPIPETIPVGQIATVSILQGATGRPVLPLPESAAPKVVQKVGHSSATVTFHAVHTGIATIVIPPALPPQPPDVTKPKTQSRPIVLLHVT